MLLTGATLHIVTGMLDNTDAHHLTLLTLLHYKTLPVSPTCPPIRSQGEHHSDNMNKIGLAVF